MTDQPAVVAELETLLQTLHPYDALSEAERTTVAARMGRADVAAGEEIYALDAELEGLYLIADGQVEVYDPSGSLVSLLGARNSFGERGLGRDGRAVTRAVATRASRLYVLPTAEFQRLKAESAPFAKFFARTRGETEHDAAKPRGAVSELATTRIADLMTPEPITCAPEATVQEVARLMRDRKISCVLVQEEGLLSGIVTHSDLTNRALAEGLPGETPVRAIMTPDPIALSPQALGSDVLHEMLERRIEHLPVVERSAGAGGALGAVDGRLIGVVTQTDLTRRQALSAGGLIDAIALAGDVASMAGAVRQIPELLALLVGSGAPHQVTTRLITDIGDAVTRRLLYLAEHELGAPPVPYLWLACGSQGRQEQTGVSDQDNCLLLSDDLKPDDAPYFEALAKKVSDGLDVCGYFYCPGDMMATNPRWRQPVRVWRDYFKGWIEKPDPMAQMLASVMFDLRPIGGREDLFSDIASSTLEKAAGNSIFIGHMVRNSLTHTPPLGLFRNFATIRSGEHKNTVDLKHNGVAPLVDLARVYALRGRIEAVNTRVRLEMAADAGVVSPTGARDLLDAFDLIAEMRLEHQAEQVRSGRKPDNFMSPGALSDLERSHLRDAFVVVKTMQSALGQTFASML